VDGRAEFGAMMNTQEKLPQEFLLRLSKWVSLFPLETLSEDKLLTTGDVGLLAFWEQIRAKHLNADDLATIPTDVFALALGEPTRRDVTKVGGLPYRPRDLPWPASPDEGPMTFLAQFRFTESKDHLACLPGEILTVFVKNRHLDFFGEDPSYFCFEWFPLGLSDLIQNEEAPKPGWKFIICYGVRHRTVDFIDAPKCLEILNRVILDDLPDEGLYDVEFRLRSILHLGGRMKIGGLPDVGNAGRLDNQADRDLRFVASIPTILPRFGSRFRWLNCPDFAPDRYPYPPEETLEWPQEGTWINLYLNEDGNTIARCATFG
jgi:Domain of unknown function (DUF1963)